MRGDGVRGVGMGMGDGEWGRRTECGRHSSLICAPEFEIIKMRGECSARGPPNCASVPLIERPPCSVLYSAVLLRRSVLSSLISRHSARSPFRVLVPPPLTSCFYVDCFS